MTILRELFHKWNSQRLGITTEESVAAMARAEVVFEGGFAGKEFGKFFLRTAEVFGVIHQGPKGTVDLYKAHDTMQFIRQLSYPDIVIADDDPVIVELSNKESVSILDFGCGLAQTSIAYAGACG